MPVLLRCAKGHDWEAPLDTTLLPGGIPCPVCGERSTPSDAPAPSSHLENPTRFEETLLRPSILPAQPVLPSDINLAETLAPRSTPSVAEVLLPQAELSLAETLAPIAPSRHLESSRAAAGFDRQAHWPTLPGYEVLGELGKGGMGIVYKAKQTALGRIVALKMIRSGVQADREELTRFQLEAQAVARLQHANIVQIFEVGTYGPGESARPYMALEFVDGGSLADRLKGGALTMNDSARLIELLAQAVHFAHERGIVHRDLKPANVLMTSAVQHASGTGIAAASSSLGTPKITDFGLAKTIDSEAIHQTQSGQILGTPSYMAPEQATGTGQIGPHTDVYALGVILFEMVTGRLPFVATSAIEVMNQITTVEPPAPSKFAPRLACDLQTIILACLQKDPARRYSSAQALAEDLRRFQAHEPILARPVGMVERLVRWVRRRPAITAMIALVMLSVVGLFATLAVGEVARRGREAHARSEVRTALVSAQSATDSQRWDEARGHLATAQAVVRGEDGLADLTHEIDALGRDIDGHQGACEATAGFLRARDEVLFQATLASDPAAVEKTKKRLRAALAMASDPNGECQGVASYLTEGHRSELRQGQYELLLVLADLMVQNRSGRSEEATRAVAREAIGVLDQAAGLGLKTHAFHLRKTRCLEHAGEQALAATESESAKRLRPSTDLDFYLAGSEYYQRGDLKSASDSFAESLRLSPRQFWPRYFLALCHVRQGELKAARDNLTSCLAQQKFVWIYLIRGFVEGQLGRYSHAEADFEEALKLVEKQAGPAARYVLYNNRAVTSLGLKQYDAAEKDLNRAIDLDPNNYQAHVTLSQVYLFQKKTTEARNALDKAITAALRQYEAKDLESDLLLLLYRTSYRLRLQAELPDLKAALADIDAILALRGIEASPKARAARERGHLLVRLDRPKDAVSAYDQAIELQPAFPDSYRWQADVMLKLKEHRQAIAGFDRYLASGGKPLANVYRGRAIARLHLGESEKALEDLSLALGLKPDDVALRAQRGQVYLACQAYQLASADFDEALKRDAKDINSLRGRAVAKLHLARPKEAAEDAERVAELAPGDARALIGSAGVLVQSAEQIGKTSQRDREPMQTRALVLVQKALEQVPAESRSTFWRETVRRDQTLRPLRSHTEYSRLDRLHGRSTER